jgi:hypothetical protein
MVLYLTSFNWNLLGMFIKNISSVTEVEITENHSKFSEEPKEIQFFIWVDGQQVLSEKKLKKCKACYYQSEINCVTKYYRLSKVLQIRGSQLFWLALINRCSGSWWWSCIYYTTDLYNFKVRTECPEVRIKLGRCYYKSWDGKWWHELNLYEFIMHVESVIDYQSALYQRWGALLYHRWRCCLLGSQRWHQIFVWQNSCSMDCARYFTSQYIRSRLLLPVCVFDCQ